MEFTDRILKRAAKDPNKVRMLEIARRPSVQKAMLELVRDGKKPVVAMSEPLVAELGLEASRDHGLRQLAGEATAHVVETVHGCERKPGNKVITGDPVFESGQGFRLAPAGHAGGGGSAPSITELLLSMLDEEQLAILRGAVAAELERRLPA